MDIGTLPVLDQAGARAMIFDVECLLSYAATNRGVNGDELWVWPQTRLKLLNAISLRFKGYYPCSESEKNFALGTVICADIETQHSRFDNLRIKCQLLPEGTQLPTVQYVPTNPSG